MAVMAVSTAALLTFFGWHGTENQLNFSSEGQCTLSYISWIRSLVGRRKIILAYAAIVLEDGEGKILLQHRTDFDQWGLPGGILELGEDITSCARRELFEETGLTAGDLRLVGLYSDPRYDVVYPNGDQVQQFTVCFNGRRLGGEMRPDGVETKDLLFVTPAEIEEMGIAIWDAEMAGDSLRGGPPLFLPPFTVKDPVDQIGDVRPFIGSAPYIGIGATAAVVRKDGRILAAKRGESDHWHLPAGYTHIGENIAHTVQREILEETGLEIIPDKLLAVYSADAFSATYPNGDEVKNVGALFRAHIVGGQLKADGIEIVDVAWLTATELLDRSSEALRPLFQATLSHLEDGYVVM